MKERAFKFRGIYENTIAYFDFQHLYGDKTGTPCVEIENKLISVHRLEMITQFTGRQDRHGRDVYEGDIYSFGDNRYLIKWNDIVSAYGLWDLKSKNWFSVNLMTLNAGDYFYTGNIYEDAKLLKTITA